MAIAQAFEAVYQGEAWTSYSPGRAQENNTFAPLAHFMNRTAIIMPRRLAVVHAADAATHTNCVVAARRASAQRGSLYRMGSNITLRVADEQPRLYLSFSIVLAVALLSAAIGIASVLYIAQALTHNDTMAIWVIQYTKVSDSETRN